MRTLRLILAVSLCVAGLSCGRGAPYTPPTSGRLVVFVQWDQVGIPDRRVQLVEAGQERLTNAAGIVEFVAPAGPYTVRAWGINRPGPGAAYVDSPVTLRRGETTRLEIVDCLPCVLPQRRAGR